MFEVKTVYKNINDITVFPPRDISISKEKNKNTFEKDIFVFYDYFKTFKESMEFYNIHNDNKDKSLEELIKMVWMPV